MNNENAVVALANYGPDQGNGGFGTSLQVGVLFELEFFEFFE
jgi:hypothetical protein